MRHKKLNAGHVWKQVEDLLIPRLQLSLIDRAVYYFLLRHCRLEGKLRIRFSILWLARGAGLSGFSARKGVRRLVAKGALRLAERTRAGHVVEVRLPEEIRAAGVGKNAGGGEVVRTAEESDLESLDFMEVRALRQTIHTREGGLCFYCMRRLRPAMRCVDHVVPQARMGRNSYRNLVSCCMECNSQKGEQRAEDFLRWLFREGRLTSGELSGRLRALEGLAAGKMRPELPDGSNRAPSGRQSDASSSALRRRA